MMRDKILELFQKRYFSDEEIAALGPEAVPELIAMYVEASGETARSQRRSIAHILGVLDGDQAVSFLSDQYQQVKGVDPSMQVTLINALARTDHDEALAIVLPLLDADDKRLRNNAISSLGYTSRLEVLARLRQIAESAAEDSTRKYAQTTIERVEKRLT